MFTRSLAALVAALTVSMAFATTPPPPKHDPARASAAADADADAYSSSRSSSSAHQRQQQGQHQSQSAAGGDATADASADNAGNAQSISYNQPRQVPPVFLPALMVSECGAAGSAGAADSGGAGALGVAWTTKRCYALRSAINFFAIGEYETGCKLLTYVNREALRTIGETPDCKSIAQRLTIESESVSTAPPAVPPMDLSKYATREELERAFKKSQAK